VSLYRDNRIAIANPKIWLYQYINLSSGYL
jgi:hypothetical protein